MITPITLPLSLTVTDGGQPIGNYQPLAIATTDKPMATPHLNINTGDAVRDARILAKLISPTYSARWDIHDCTARLIATDTERGSEGIATVSLL